MFSQSLKPNFRKFKFQEVPQIWSFPIAICTNMIWLLLFGIVYCQSVFRYDVHGERVDKSSLEAWIADQTLVNYKNLLRNIGNSSFCVDSDIYPGVIVASPSKVMPDYYYQWTRDSALSVRTLIHYLEDNVTTPIGSQEAHQLVEHYIWNNHHLQRLSTLSGDFSSGGLGEPKFLVNNSQFNLNWGRPQNDGPGLRVSSIIKYLNLDHNLNITYIYGEILKPDVVFILNNWKKTSFDLWEEINSLHFFTSIVQLKGLVDAKLLIERHNLDQDPQFTDLLNNTIESMTEFIKSYYQGPDYVLETPFFKPRNGLDAAVLLGSIHSHDMNLDDHLIPFDIDHPSILNHLAYMYNDMKKRYPVNYNQKGVGIGRYPEDIYDGYGTSEGNPWFISTATAAEIIYRYLHKLSGRDIVITKANSAFFSLVGQSDNFKVIPFGSDEFKATTQALRELADSFLEIIKDHVDSHGGISEQFNKYHGFMQGARDLTWSYASLVSAFRWRSILAVKHLGA